mgnify:CR=1
MARLYLRDKEIVSKRGVHTVYTGNDVEIGNKAHKVKSTIFFLGSVKDIEAGDAARLKDLGHASSKRPSMPEDEDDDVDKITQ